MRDYQFTRWHEGDRSAQNVEVFTYPMGETTLHATPGAEVLPGTQVLRVYSSSPDWSVVYAWAQMMQTLFPTERRVLVMPFLPSARGDKDTPAPAVVNAVLAAQVPITDLITLDPHSPVWLDAYRAHNDRTTVHVIEAHKVTYHAVAAAAVNRDEMIHTGFNPGLGYDIVLSPDKGARDRAARVAIALGGIPVGVAAKRRDPATGRILSLSYDFPEGMEDATVLVVDDICDGGGTFALLAKSLPDGVTADLWVSHGGFTKGLEGTGLNRYRTILTTDSLPSATRLWLETPEKITMTYLDPFINETLASL